MQALKIAGIIILLLIAMFFPFLPGNYDGLAVTLSAMAQLFAITGLILIPIGISWLIFGLRKRNSHLIHYRFAMITWIVCLPLVLIVSLGAIINQHALLGYITLIIGVIVAVRTFRHIRQLRKAIPVSFHAAPWYLICIPLILAIVRFTCIKPAIDFSRSRAISQSQPLIQDIEAYHTQNGHYPVSLLSLWEDYKPAVKGIHRYHYELNGSAYNLYFEQFAYELSTREIVMYNKLDQQTMTSHNQDLLTLTPADLDLQRGFFAKSDLPEEHWKYFWFD